jgi:hypothetical protein
VTLRRAVLGLGALAVLLGLLLIAFGHLAAGGIQLVLLGAVAVLGVLLEARRYRGSGRSSAGQATSERFVDPTTGRLTEVRYDPSTGERQYVDVGPASPPP